MGKAPVRKVGRPKGSTNKRVDKGFIKQFSKLALEVQADILGKLNAAFTAARDSRAAELMFQLKALGVEAPRAIGQMVGRNGGAKKRGRPPKAASAGHSTNDRTPARKGRRGGKVAAKFQSKKDSSLKWTGRGMTPKWMVAEMKGTKLKKDDFLIA